MYYYLHESLKLLNLRPAVHIRMQKVDIIDTCLIVRKFLA
jgi:hypothetical protein